MQRFNKTAIIVGLVITIVGAGFLVAKSVSAQVFGAPTTIFQRNLLPEATSRYDLGTTTSIWNRLFANYASSTAVNAVSFCLDGDTCITSWPSSSIVGTISTSSAETKGQIPYFTSTNGYPATVGSVATSSFAVQYPLLYSGTLGALIGGSGGTLSSALSTTTSNTWGGTQTFTNAAVFSGTGTTTFAGPIDMSGASGGNHLTTHGIRSDGSDGIHFHANDWTRVADFGPANTANVSFYGGVNIDGQTRLATNLTGWAYLTSGVVSASSSPTVNWLYATNTTATSTFAGNVHVVGNLEVNGAAFYPVTFTSGPVTAPYFTATSTTQASTFPYASSTALSVSSALWTNVTSAVLLADANKLVGAASTQTCTNQFIRVLSAAYIATCASVSLTADVSGILPIANGGTNASSFTATNGLTAYDGTRLVNFSGYTLTSSLLTATNASTTALSVNGNEVSGERYLSQGYATSTAWTATTTVETIARFNGTFVDTVCETDVGTLNVQYYVNSTAVTPMFSASTTKGTVTFTGSKTFVKGDTLKAQFGTPASSPTDIDCTARATGF